LNSVNSRSENLARDPALGTPVPPVSKRDRLSARPLGTHGGPAALQPFVFKRRKFFKVVERPIYVWIEF
jgi:hypothetical protein